ncbi:hypothetical protein CONCODRAFT_79516 [Conidiobolus coronatus NRRL 28638]|uniref:Xylanolytic transcriptional activator regulatory domain-containing protein n=1 Tax=Conidiobolus coronatus (strain ATCC 28846 / CBS 209.66 / NRRL 28638) TaxID=796925 RepID=A0A137P282_CONC2|nr:hypothetical protein CONCODRAFT_79516 [Conidiobolus coronatus NRRL 28638]|eukprot:KXN69058.1 hypothetical protein CONCODRAFT_79516 [Conidiobolus coronatus NRRL 28638]
MKRAQKRQAPSFKVANYQSKQKPKLHLTLTAQITKRIQLLENILQKAKPAFEYYSGLLNDEESTSLTKKQIENIKQFELQLRELDSRFKQVVKFDLEDGVVIPQLKELMKKFHTNLDDIKTLVELNLNPNAIESRSRKTLRRFAQNQNTVPPHWLEKACRFYINQFDAHSHWLTPDELFDCIRSETPTILSYSVLALMSRFLDDDAELRQEQDLELYTSFDGMGVTQFSRFCALSAKKLVHSCFIDPSLYTVIALAFLALFEQTYCHANGFSTYYGSAVKLAQTMGLAPMAPEQIIFGMLLLSPQQQKLEIRKQKIWASLVIGDLLASQILRQTNFLPTDVSLAMIRTSQSLLHLQKPGEKFFGSTNPTGSGGATDQVMPMLDEFFEMFISFQTYIEKFKLQFKDSPMGTPNQFSLPKELMAHIRVRIQNLSDMVTDYYCFDLLKKALKIQPFDIHAAVVTGMRFAIATFTIYLHYPALFIKPAPSYFDHETHYIVLLAAHNVVQLYSEGVSVLQLISESPKTSNRFLMSQYFLEAFYVYLNAISFNLPVPEGLVSDTFHSKGYYYGQLKFLLDFLYNYSTSDQDLKMSLKQIEDALPAYKLDEKFLQEI